MEIYTQFNYEKKWTKTSEKEALRLILEEMPHTDEIATLNYILSVIKKDKIVTLGNCRFQFKNGLCG